jgi:hypothetical protein
VKQYVEDILDFAVQNINKGSQPYTKGTIQGIPNKNIALFFMTLGIFSHGAHGFTAASMNYMSCGPFGERFKRLVMPTLRYFTIETLRFYAFVNKKNLTNVYFSL